MKNYKTKNSASRIVKIFKIVSIVFVMAFLSSCSEFISESKSDDYPERGVKHALRKFNVKTTVSEHSSASYFVIMGGYSSSKSEHTNVRFYFKNCKEEYQFQELPLNGIRIKTDSTVKEPYITFDFENYHAKNRCYESDLKWIIGSATIYCKETDFQPEININDLK